MRRGLHRVAGQGLVCEEPKTRRSRRTVALPRARLRRCSCTRPNHSTRSISLGADGFQLYGSRFPSARLVAPGSGRAASSPLASALTTCLIVSPTAMNIAAMQIHPTVP